MSQDFEQKYMGVLQNIEATVVQTAKAHPELTDWNVEKVYRGLIRRYDDIAAGRQPLTPDNLAELDRELYQAVQAVCDWNMKPEPLLNEANEELHLEITPTSPTEIVACLKRLLKSVEKWSKAGGRRGYLSFIEKYVH